MNEIIQGDCLVKLKELPENSVDSIVTDPPYELGFMGKSWDNTGIANSKELWQECLRVLKPGGHLLSFSGTRTYHRMACAIEDAGFEVRDMIEWCYGSGFPKSLNIGKAVKAYQETGGSSPRNLRKSRMGNDYKPTGQKDYCKGRMFSSEIENDDTKEALNNEWEGWGTALKPAHEPICMARKPLSEKTVAENCLKYGTGGINIDESRVGTTDKYSYPNGAGGNSFSVGEEPDGKRTEPVESNSLGRFPANLIHDNSEEVRECFPETKSGSKPGQKGKSIIGSEQGETRQEIENAYGDSGNASRFFKSIAYYAKASKSERNMGCEGLPVKQTTGGGGMNDPNGDDVCGKYGSVKTEGHNFHPTVKPIALMEYLIKMITPKGGTILDPFMGSGSTGVAAILNNYNFIGIERELDYIKIARARIEYAEKEYKKNNQQQTLI